MGRVADILSSIRESLALLDRKLEERGPRELVEDSFSLNAVLHILQIAAQALIDLASHVAAEAGVGVADRYSTLPRLLREAGALSDEEAALFKRIIGFRNVVVHGYLRVSKSIVLEILSEHKHREILRLALRIAEWASRRGVDP
ncbi:MAG: DUF86 domain-containing protein [Thermoprotei archaeon]|nr:MAG: DUF86 domain-containing protein [Thermoprotei archaeon]